MIQRVLGYKVSLDDDSWENRGGKLVASRVVTSVCTSVLFSHLFGSWYHHLFSSLLIKWFLKEPITIIDVCMRILISGFPASWILIWGHGDDVCVGDGCGEGQCFKPWKFQKANRDRLTWAGFGMNAYFSGEPGSISTSPCLAKDLIELPLPLNGFQSWLRLAVDP